MNFFQRRKLKKLLEQVEKERIETLERCLEFWKNTAYEYQNKYYDLKQNEG